MLPFHWNYLGIMGQLFGNNGYLLAESENSIMGIQLGIIVSAFRSRTRSWCHAFTHVEFGGRFYLHDCQLSLLSLRSLRTPFHGQTNEVSELKPNPCIVYEAAEWMTITGNTYLSLQADWTLAIDLIIVCMLWLWSTYRHCSVPCHVSSDTSLTWCPPSFLPLNNRLSEVWQLAVGTVFVHVS